MENNNEETLKVTWLGQGGFLIEINRIRILIDPYLSDSLSARGLKRLYPVPVKLEDLRPEVVFFTHDHADHFDEQTVRPLAELYPHCKMAGPASVYEHYIRLSLKPDCFTVFNCGDIYGLGDISVKAVPAYHTDPYSIGMVISFGERKIYLSGDTLLDDRLIPAVKQETGLDFDLMMICINGKLGNMNAIDALYVTSQLHPRIVIPMHYGLFAENTTDPEPFVNAVSKAGLQCLTMVPGQPVEFK
ncbi:MBL fold metallo-hydrolase [Arcticibacter tournemirensis]